jgi:hypothetical protein
MLGFLMVEKEATRMNFDGVYYNLFYIAKSYNHFSCHERYRINRFRNETGQNREVDYPFPTGSC